MKTYKQSLNNNKGADKNAQLLYESAQLFLNFLLDSDYTDNQFKNKIMAREGLKFYLHPTNRGKFNNIDGKSLKLMKYILKPQPLNSLNLEVGHYKTIEIGAGQTFEFSVEVSAPLSIICINFQTIDYDIQFGLYATQPSSKFEIVNPESDNEQITFSLDDSPSGLVEAIPLKIIEYTPSAIKITYTSNKIGFYRVVFSN